ncbi:XRE family transcriptional regulator [Lachnospiraceae bacterium TF10-8AT]|jgi:transcriptional regulator with XRE-family HTH domain|nr:XRE family transcriptional regulator [Lachnospiraceae bacterium TF10-8AT]DAQ17938.1 MAG TPA: helix-turn-helix domain protein [Bacteriophage sp.]
MYEIFEKLLKGRGITAYRFCKDTGVSTSTISTWKKKNSKIGMDLAETISNYFGVSIDYLMTGKEDEQKEKDNTDLKQKYRELEELLRSDSMKPVRYDGKPVNNDTIDLLLKQIEISLAMLKK